MFQGMREVYSSCGVDVEWVSEETLNLPHLTVVEAGTCKASSITGEQVELFGNRNFAGVDDVVVYFVQSTIPPFNGCAAHPEGKPGAIIAAIATEWTLGHEVGHVLGLRHVANERDRLMTAGGTAGLTNPPPDLVVPECATMAVSPLVVKV
jgi:hypothetical protein